MTYGLSGPAWSRVAGHNAALYTAGGEFSLDASRAYYLGRGVPAAKLLLGLPFYGTRFDSASAINQPLASTAGAAVTYRDIIRLMGNGWSLKRDEAAQVPYLVRLGEAGLLSYDDPASISAKCAFTHAQGMGGVIIWHLGQDDTGTSQPLLQAAATCRYHAGGASHTIKRQQRQRARACPSPLRETVASVRRRPVHRRAAVQRLCSACDAAVISPLSSHHPAIRT
jgi:chitinase